MAKESYWKWLRHNTLDPLWWLFTVPILANGIMALFHLVGSIDSFSLPFSLIGNTASLLSCTSLLVSAVRGESIGDRRPMSLEARVGWGGVSVLVIILVLEASLRILG